MSRTKVISLDLLAGSRVSEIPVTALKYGWSYQNGLILGYVSGKVILPKLATNADRIRAAIYNDAVEEWTRHLFVDRDGVIMGDGIVVASPYTDADRARTIESDSTLAYLHRRTIDSRQAFAGVDQFVIARTVIGAALSQTNGNIGITMGAEVSGVTQDVTYERYDTKNLGQALEQLASLENGFDISIDCSWDPTTGDPIKLLRLHYPRRGRPYSQSRIVFEYGRNMTCDWPSTAVAMTNRLYGLGDGSGESMLISVATDPASIAENHPILEDTFPIKDVASQDQLDLQTRAELRARSKPAAFPKMTVRADKDPVLGGYIVGDSCKVRFPPGKCPRFPSGFETYRQITNIDVTVDDKGVETVEVTTGEDPNA